jgi:formylglycine-generating enzyme required for sulfatase activity
LIAPSIALPFLAFVQAGAEPPPAPPGLVLVKGGKTSIGTKVDDVEDLIRQHEEMKFALAAETPQFTLEVADFYLMPTEVTNEQYALFVRSTEGKPPCSWGTKALDQARAAFLEEQGKKKAEARQKGETFEAATFDPEAWWEKHWKEAPWEVPDKELALPVVYVNYADAQRYARWAGLRLMTEFEFTRAGRGDGDQPYPWGAKWDDKKYCHSLHLGKDQASPVGSYPEGAVNGIFDLCGNVWEWTSSPYDKFPGYKPVSVKIGKRNVEGLGPFDPDMRVAVSGSFQMPSTAVRLSTRKGCDRTQSTNALGFRCAASVEPGRDAAEWIIAQDLKLSVLSRDARLAPGQSAALRQWTTAPSQVAVPGYAAIASYEHVLFCPVEKAPASTTVDLGKHTAEHGPLFLGFVDLVRPLKEPELDGGTYWVAWRGAAPLKGQPAPAAKPKDSLRVTSPSSQETGVPFQELPGFDPNVDCYVFYDLEGSAQAVLPAPPVVAERVKPCSLRVEPFVPPEKPEKDAPPPVPLDTLRVTVFVLSATSNNKGFGFDLPIKLAPGAIGQDFR